MSTRYNTGNPIESADVRDMSDNAKNFDEFSISTQPTFNDRFGVARKTLQSLISKAEQDIYYAAINAGFQPASFDFVTGGTLVSGDRNKAVFNPEPSGDNNWYAWQGVFQKVISPNSTPATSGGLGDNAWKPVTNNILAPTVRESIRRSFAEAGYNLVDGSFEAGGTLVNANDVLLQERTGKSFTGPAGPVAAGTDPTNGGFVDVSAVLLRDFVNQELAKTNSQVETIAPSLPGVTSDNKFFMAWGEPGVRGYIISRTKNGFYSAVALTNEVSPSDARNTGGASNFRPGKVLKCSALKLAKTRAHSKTTGVAVSSLTPTQIQSIWGYTHTSLFQVVTNAVADFDWNNPNVYSVPYSSSANESITYRVNAGRSATVIFGVSGGSSNNVLIETSFDGVTFAKYRDVDTSGGISGRVLRKEVEVITGAPNPWYIRITNKTTAAGSFAYVAGLNIMNLPRDGLWDFDSVILQIVGGVSTDLSYQMVNGANEFAALESTTGKWFGTYHGGHSDFLERLRIDSGVSIDIRGALTSSAYMSSSFELYSQSTLTSSGGVVCNYSSVTQFGDGCHITSYAVKPISQPNIRCFRVFTHMCTTSPNFERVILPEYAIKEDDGLVPIGNVQHCKQDRANDVSSVRCWWSGVRSVNNVYGGGYISFQPNYNKQYYGPIVDITNYFSGGMFVTAKEYT